MSPFADLLFLLMLLAGTFFIVTAAVGIVRFPDVYTRLHTASKASTFGFAFIVLAVAWRVGTPADMTKAVMAVLFQFATAPIGAHMIARVAVQKGLRPVSGRAGEPLDFPDAYMAPEGPGERAGRPPT